MPGTVIGKNMNYGYPGQISRHGDEVSRTRPVKASTSNIKFGAPVVQNTDGSVQLFGATNVAADFAGVAMRKVKSATIYPSQNFGYYEPLQPCDVLERGGVIAICAWGTPAVGGDVYVRTVVAEGVSPTGAAIGDFGAEQEGTAVAGANTYTITTNAANDDEITFAGVTLKAGTDFSVGANAAATGPLLAAAFAQSAAGDVFFFNAVGAAITVTEKVPGGGNTPGNMTVKSGGTAVITKGTATASAAANAVKLDGVKWSSAADARNCAELTIVTRQGV